MKECLLLLQFLAVLIWGMLPAFAGKPFAQLYDVSASHPNLSHRVDSKKITGLHWIDSHQLPIVAIEKNREGKTVYVVKVRGSFDRKGWDLYFQGHRVQLEGPDHLFEIVAAFTEGQDRLALQARRFDGKTISQSFLIKKFERDAPRSIASVPQSRTDFRVRQQPRNAITLEAEPTAWNLKQTLQSDGSVFGLGGNTTNSFRLLGDFRLSREVRFLGFLGYRGIEAGEQVVGDYKVTASKVSLMAAGGQFQLDLETGEDSLLGFYLGAEMTSVPFLEFENFETLNLKEGSDLGVALGLRYRWTVNGKKEGSFLLMEAGIVHGLGVLSTAATSWKSRDEYVVRTTWDQSLGGAISVRVGVEGQYQKNIFVIKNDTWNSSNVGVSGIFGFTYRFGE